MVRWTASWLTWALPDGKVDSLTADLGTANGKVDSLTADLGTANGEVDRLTGESATANGDIEDLREALRLAGVSTVIAMSNSEYVAAKKAYDDLMAAYGKANADVKAATALVAAANAAKAKADAAHTVAGSGTVAQMTAAADNVAAADSAVSAAKYELKQAETTADAMPYAMAIMMQATAPEELAASAKRTDNEVEVSVTSDPGEMLIAKVITSDEDDGWYRANVANEDGDQTATVYTNIENTMAKFNAVHNDDADYITVANGVLALDNEQVAMLKDLVSAAAFPGASLGELKLPYDGTDENPSKFDGTFGGVPGSYNCDTTTTCTATADSDGELTALEGEWTFIPAYLGEDEVSMTPVTDTDEAIASREDDLPVPSVAIEDTMYEHFGWWTMVDEDGVVDFQTFFGGTDEAAFTADPTGLGLEGTATYKGPSAGRYAVKTFNSNSTLDSIRHGEFTAAAELTAKFGGSAIAEDDQHSISGEVTNFVSQNGDDLSAWKVELKEADMGTDGTFTGDEVEVEGGVGGSPVSSGSWSGQFFGNTVDILTALPTSVTGEFDAHSSHGHVAGGFGAVKQ